MNEKQWVEMHYKLYNTLYLYIFIHLLMTDCVDFDVVISFKSDSNYFNNWFEN